MKNKLKEFYRKHKFPLTVEPLLIFWSVGFGMTEVVVCKISSVSFLCHSGY